MTHRYELEDVSNPARYGDSDNQLVENKEGDWVKHEDHIKAVEELEGKVEKLAQTISFAKEWADENEWSNVNIKELYELIKDK